jgi:hypothetical protein
VGIANLGAATYYTDKRQDGAADYRHPFAYPPRICVPASGNQIVLVGGSYVVTPDGIEDVEP